VGQPANLVVVDRGGKLLASIREGTLVAPYSAA
jgi:hypothetical protein